MNRIIRSSLSLIIIVLLFVAPFQLTAQRHESSLADAETMAAIDAEEDINKIQWLGCGCIGTAIGVGAAYLMVPAPRPDRLMGKSPEYIWAYTSVYRSKARSIQTKLAFIGCGVTGIIATAVVIFLAANACNDANCQPIDTSCGLEGCSDSEGCSSSSTSCSDN